MSMASSSSLRALARPTSRLVFSVRAASTSTEQSSSSYPSYQPRPYYNEDDDFAPLTRPPRPASPVHFTGKPFLSAEMSAINAMLKDAHAQLRADYLYPIPNGLMLPTPPMIRWRDRRNMTDIFRETIRHGQHTKMVTLLNELHRASYLAELGGKSDLADKISAFLTKYATREVVMEKQQKKAKDLDGNGAAHGAGRRKTASAEVWLIPAKSALEHLDAERQATKDSSNDWTSMDQPKAFERIPTAEVIVNHLALPLYFSKVQDRQALLRPLKLTGLLGAYNVLARVEGGGTTGQAEAIAVGLARALLVMRPETKDVLFADGALMRDPRMVERKKTNMHKARKARTWVKR